MSWSRALARPRSPKTSSAASMICCDRCSGRRRHFGETGLDRGIFEEVVTDQSVRYGQTRLSANGNSLELVRSPRYFLPAIVRVRHHHDRGEEQEKRDRAEDQSSEASTEVGLLFRRHHL